jgi:hypothetical protein
MDVLPHSTLNELIDRYAERLNQDNKNMERIKKFYNDDKSFDLLMEKIIEKDLKRFEKFIQTKPWIPNIENNLPNSWRALYVVLDIVQNEGEEVPPFDFLTRSLPSRTIMYHGWTFSWVHGEGTLISIFNRNDELVYRF